MTTLFVTHDQSEAMAIADRVAVMNRGRIVQIDTPEGIYARPRTRFVASFIGRANLFEAEAVRRLKATTRLKAADVDLAIARQADGRMTLVLRPEAVSLSPPRKPAPNSARGTVETATYLGSIAQFAVRAGTTTILAEVSGAQASDYSPGTEVTVSWPASALWIVDD